MGKRIYIADAISDHPINTGLISRWQALPGQQRGNVFRDLCMRNHGTLTNGPTWKNTKYGFPALDFVTASSQYVSLPAFSFTSPYTLFAVVDIDAADSAAGAILNWDDDTAGTRRIFQFRIDTSGVLRLVAFSTNATLAQAAGTTNLIGRGPTVVFATWDNANARVYVDGKEEGSAAFADSLTNSSPNPIRLFGGGMNMGASYTDGRCHLAGIYSRAISAGEVAALSYDLRLGSPQTLNWISTRTYFGVTAAPPATNRRRRVLMCAGS